MKFTSYYHRLGYSDGFMDGVCMVERWKMPENDMKKRSPSEVNAYKSGYNLGCEHGDRARSTVMEQNLYGMSFLDRLKYVVYGRGWWSG